MNDQKATLRKQIRAAVGKISSTEQLVASGHIRTRLKEHAIWANARSVLFFVPLPDEVDIWPLLEEAITGGKIAALPRFDFQSQSYVVGCVRNLQSDLVTGQFGIREPSAACPEISLHNPDLILVPGIAFDLHGHRLGRGKGFYDQLLAAMDGIKCGVAFDEQVVDEVPVGRLDVRVDYVLTPSRLIKTTD
ncbi:MAG TPA: 5-formyltetrahydrofolate cyclo-ligase [Candidatus Saccharimonadales bacterium]|nr:5-formyltetrahydrofolate cyclo-ligase [Candidatus Saccharimonadales bacterium]